MRHLKLMHGEHSVDPNQFLPLEKLLFDDYGCISNRNYPIEFGAFCDYLDVSIAIGFVEHGKYDGGVLESLILAEKEMFRVLMGKESKGHLEYSMIHNTGDLRVNIVLDNFCHSYPFSSGKSTAQEVRTFIDDDLIKKHIKIRYPEVIRLAIGAARHYDSNIQRRFVL